MEVNTLEEARAEILRLEEELNERTTERDTLSQNNDNLSHELETVRELNQKYYLKLRAQNRAEESEKDEEEEEAPTCEEFAKSLHII